MEVHVVGRADHHGIDLFFHLVEHFAEVVELLRVRESREGVAGPDFVDVAQGDDVLLRNAVQVRLALAAQSDHGDVGPNCF